MTRFWSCFIILISLLGVLCEAYSPPPTNATAVTQTQYGPVQGFFSSPTGAQVFLGVPFAAPPVGTLRFESPQPPTPWTSVLQTTNYQPSCPQAPQDGLHEISEDCLYLNIFAPADATSGNTSYPVLLYWYGGAFVEGSANLPEYQGEVLATKGDIIVVLANHRLGALGFFALGALVPGNQGLRDQQLTMKWIRTNIAQFGGDPSRLTIGGQSAGGLAGNWHMVIPSSKGLFDAVLAMSGPMIYQASTPQQAIRGVDLFISGLGCNKYSSENLVLDCLRNASVAAILNATGGLCAPDFGWWTRPTVDGDFLPGQPADLLLQGKANLLPILQGTTLNEFYQASGTYNTTSYQEAVTISFPGKSKQFLEELLAVYPPVGDLGLQFSNIFNDWIIHCPLRYQSQYISSLNISTSYTYQYFFSHRASFSNLPPGASHGMDIDFLFQNPDNFFSNNVYTFTSEELQLSDNMIFYYSNFVKTFDPNTGGNNGVGLPYWPVYSVDNDLSLNENLTMSVVPGFRGPQCDFWTLHSVTPNGLWNLHPPC